MDKKKITADLVFADYKPIVFDEKAKKMNTGRVCRGNFRLSNGMWRTDKEKELFIKKSFEKELS